MSVNPEHYAEFLSSMGHTVRRTEQAWWFNVAPRIYSSFPFHRTIDATQTSVSEVLGRDGVALRAGVCAGQGVESSRLICDTPDYGFDVLRSRTRTQVRRGLEACNVRRVSFSDLGAEAIRLNGDTLIRQGRKVPDDLESYWHRYYEAADRTEGAEAWIAECDGKMAAYLISFCIEDTCNLLILRSRTELLKSFPNNALLFEFLQEALARPDVSRVSYGYESIRGRMGSLDQFKSGMGFHREPVDQMIRFAPWISPLISRPTISLMQPVVRRLVSGDAGEKLGGMLDHYKRQLEAARAA